MPLRVENGRCDLWPVCRQTRATCWMVADTTYRTLCRECFHAVYREWPS